MGLYILPNEPNGTINYRTWSFTREGGFPGIGPIADNLTPGRVTGTPFDDTITFEFDRFLYHVVHSWYQGVWSYGVSQRRLITGEIVLEAVRPGRMTRCCWTTANRMTGEGVVQETATGLVSISQLEQRWEAERWALTLYRGEYFLDGDELVEAEDTCAGTAGA